MSRIPQDLHPVLIETANEMAAAARAAILPYFRNPELMADNKDEDGFDPVTEADRAAEAAMRHVLQQRRPMDSIFGEEMGQHEGDSGLTWVLDPIDGTRGFLSGTPTWGVLIALSDQDGPVMGIVDQPYIGERFFGGFGQAYCDGPVGRRSLHVRKGVTLDEAILFSTFPEVGSVDEGRAFRNLAKRVKLVRYGMDCYAYALLAAGQIDLVVEAGLNAYDIQGPQAVIEAAGGIVTDWNGGPAHNGGRIIAAASEEIHAAALELLHDGLATI
ncbi:histidinol-phosphatase [Donghicola tyrosinivorans]|uniref:Histidinol-phosphatase n=1 Tax=Donghicola tyrosinivorans TaxID=1652492 RepID=A0A2T0X4R4_9RHOB|nr:histidinol-phosphatase [Donghicola tyrosinivorans]PRY93917.1 histidinol phosphatase-like enzyme (inositol monophosphatase family) [Donghicola tyrosinivorans]